MHEHHCKHENRLYPRWIDAPLVDSHCHLEKIRAFDESIDSTLLRYETLCVLDVGIEPDDWQRRRELFGAIAGVYGSVGLHPSAYGLWELEQARAKIERHAEAVAAVGESGLDWHTMYTSPETQYEFFEMQLSIAQKYNKPIIIHARGTPEHDAVESVLEVLHRVSYTGTGIMHCFSGTKKQAARCMDMGMYISFSAVLSYSSAAEMLEAAAYVPVNRLLVETDAPYLLHKDTHRWQKQYWKHSRYSASGNNIKPERYNHPAYMPFLYETLAVIRNTDAKKIAHDAYHVMRYLLRV